MCCLGFIPVESLAVAFLALVCLFKFDELSFLLDFFSTVSQKKLFKLRLSQCPAMSAPPHLSCPKSLSHFGWISCLLLVRWGSWRKDGMKGDFAFLFKLV